MTWPFSLNRSYLCGLFVIGVLTGCKSSNKEEAVARVGDATITVTDFKGRLHDTPPAYQQYVTTPEGRRQFLNLLIREKVLLTESRKAGLQKDENYRKAIAEFKKKSERELADYQEALLVEMYLARLRSKELGVTDAEIRRYYDEHAADFAQPVEVQASHILVKSPEEAQNVLERLQQGEPFDALARAVSMDPATATRGGKLAPFTKGSLMPEFEKAVFQLKEGQTSGVVKSAFGYHVVKKISQRMLPSRSFEQATDDIRNRIQREKFDQWVTQAQSSTGVKIDEKALEAVSVASKGSAESGVQ